MNRKIYALMIGLFAGLALQAQTTYTVNYLIVAGGGGGGYSGAAGGGGAGGLLQSTISLGSGGTYPVVVGNGGAGGSATGSSSGSNGGNSSVFGLTAIGGGGGSAGQGNSGGSGGGSGRTGTSIGATGTAGQGYAGGSAGWYGNQYPSSGGGGAGAKGEDDLSNNPGHSGSGGIGISSSISGTATYYAGGGGGGGDYGCGRGLVAGTGGIGGGGNGGNGSNISTLDGVAGTPNTGGGGGGAAEYTDCSTSGNGGNGGSGIVILSFPTGSITYTQTGGVVTTSGGNTVITFNSSGTFNVTGTSTITAQPWQLKTDSANGPIYHMTNVGIGNNNPQLPLDVTGNARISGNLYVGGGLIESPQISAITSLNTDSINALSGSIKFADTVKMAKTLKVNNNIDAKSISFGGVPTFSFTPATGAIKNQLNLLTNASITGSVSISSLAGNPGLNGLYADSLGNLKILPLVTPGIGITLCNANIPAAPWTINGNILGAIGDALIGPCDNHDFVMQAYGNPYVWLKTSGKLGIGNNSPGAMLDIKVPSGTAVGFNMNNSSDTSIFNIDNTGNITSKALALSSSTANRSLSVDPTGKIIAGSVAGTTGAAWTIGGNSGTGMSGILGTTDGADLILTAGADPSHAGVGVEKLRILANGNIVLNNDNATNNTQLLLKTYGGSNPDIHHGLGFYDSSFITSGNHKLINGPVLYGYEGGALGTTSFFTGTAVTNNNNVALAWDNSGHVYIGAQRSTASPYNAYNVLLSVSGKMVAQEIFVANTAAGWADYVFKKDYKLMPLSEVEKYISSNQHLPNVPSAHEIEDKGQNLGDLQVKQMEKTEELYLYIIELNKKLEAQNSKIDAQDSKLKKLEELNKKLTADLTELKNK